MRNKILITQEAANFILSYFILYFIFCAGASEEVTDIYKKSRQRQSFSRK